MNEQSGGVYCSLCKKCLSRPRKRKVYRQPTEITCEECINSKFSSHPFTLDHVGDNRWIIKQTNGAMWCGVHEWVDSNSAYFVLTPDCYAQVFSFDELIDFVREEFGTNLKS